MRTIPCNIPIPVIIRELKRNDFQIKLIDIDFSIHLNSEANPLDEPTSSPTKENPPPVLNFLESLSNRVPLGNKHPDAKSYVYLVNFL
jgi:hypothetical protein